MLKTKESLVKGREFTGTIRVVDEQGDLFIDGLENDGETTGRLEEYINEELEDVEGGIPQAEEVSGENSTYAQQGFFGELVEVGGEGSKVCEGPVEGCN